MTDEPQFVIDPNSVPGQIAALGRYTITAIGSFALGRGWISSDVLQLITGLLTVALPTGFAIYKTWDNKKKLVTIAASAPDSVAVVKQ